MIPIAKIENLLIEEVGNELIVYDQQNHSSYCLNPIASTVWHHCNGNNTINDIAKLLEKELNLSANPDVDIRGLVYLTVEELEGYNLIKDYVKQPIDASAIPRRKVVKKGVLLGAFAVGSMFPLVRSIVAPEATMALSVNCPRNQVRIECPPSVPSGKIICKCCSASREGFCDVDFFGNTKITCL